MTISDFARLVSGFTSSGLRQTINGNQEPPPTGFAQYTDQLFAANPVVWGAIQIRKAVFSQAQFKYQRLSTGEMFGNPTLRLLERPWPGGTTAKLLTRMLQHADIGGNSYVLDLGNRYQLMRPDWVSIILGSDIDADEPVVAEDAKLVGYFYMPRGVPGEGRFYPPERVAHFAPMPDPLAHWRGISWLTPVVKEILGDNAMIDHKLKFFEQGATPNIVIKFDASQTINQVKAFKELVEEDTDGLANAYKTLYLGGGADATVVGSSLEQLDFSKTIGKAETRILMAAGVHPVIAGASEGMQGASLNAGNFSQVRRIFSDIHLQDLWNEAAASLEVLVRPPPGSKLVMDGRDMPFLQQDAKDQAEIQREQARAITTFWRDGADTQSAIDAIVNNDMSQLSHTGFLSVQLQPPGMPVPGQDDSTEDDEEGDDE